MPFIETNGIKMHYEEKGEGDPLILIMGLVHPELFGNYMLMNIPSILDVL